MATYPRPAPPARVKPPLQLIFAVQSILRWIAFVIFGLFLLSTLAQGIKYFLGFDYLMGLVPALDFSEDGNIPNWFSSLLLAFCSFCLALIACSAHRNGRSYRWHWAGLSVGFLLASMDEAARLHELTSEPVRRLLGVEGSLYFAWIIPAAVLVLLLGLTYLKFLLDLPVHYRRYFLLAAAIYLSGAIGMEMLGAHYFLAYGRNHYLYTLAATCEELMEFTGLFVFVYALLSYLQREVLEIKVRLTG